MHRPAERNVRAATTDAKAPATVRGLTSQEAAERLRRDGPNLLPQPERRRRWEIIGNVLREPMLLLLLGAAAVYLLLGDPREAAVLGASVLLVIGLTIYQEQKSERALQALRDLSSPRARVLRDGEPQLIAGRDVVVGDVVLVAEGDRIPADARVLEESDLQVDESMLTGESVPVRCPVSNGDKPGLHASTLVVRGRGTAEVVAIAGDTAVGRIGAALHSIRRERTPMQREMRRVVLLFTAIGLASCVLVVLLYRATRGGWLDALLAGITLAMSNIPEEFPVVLTVFLALGGWRMAQQKALVREPPTIEALGAITVLCTDKTGTLTENRMAVAELAADGEQANSGSDGPPSTSPASTPGSRLLLQTAALASEPNSYDPMDRALRDAGARVTEISAALEASTHIREYPLSPERPAVAHAWSRTDAAELLVACKGAPETVADLCRLPPPLRAALMEEVDAMARRGLRVLAAATATWPPGSGSDRSADPAASLPDQLEDLAFEWRGLVGFADPLRAGVSDAVDEAHAAGIRLIMLTGDHIETARAIAHEAGLADGDEVMLGHDLDALDDEHVQQRIERANVFARVRPEHKLRLVDALKRAGHVVAMTGDGVNDAPALMASHVGIAMGARGTDVAREAASIVLLDDNFVTVVRAISIGRTIYDNIRRAVRYILAVHVPITGLALLPMLTGGPLILLPLHVVFLELIIDPVCSIAFEREPPAPDIMRRPPRPTSQRLLDTRSLLASLGHGGAMFASVAFVYLMAPRLGLPATELGALAFTAVVGGNLGLIVLYRSGSLRDALLRPNRALQLIVPVTLLLLAVVTQVDAPAAWFGFAPPPLDLSLMALAMPLLTAATLKLAGAHVASRRLKAPAHPRP